MLKLVKHDIFKCILSGILLTLGWPPVSFTPLLFLAWVPLFTVIDHQSSWKKIWACAYISCLVWTLGTMYWIGNTRIDFGGLLIIIVAWVFIPFFQSLPLLIFGWIKNKINSWLCWFILPAIWVSYEYLHSNWELAFTWLHLGFGLSPAPWLIQFYEITGYLGGSLVIVLVNVVFFLMIRHHRRPVFRPLSYVLASVASLVIIFNLLLYPQPGVSVQKEVVKAAIVQSNTDPYEKLDQNSLQRQVLTLQKLLQPIKKEQVDLVVLSEGFLRTSPMQPLILNNIDAQPAVKEIKKISHRIDAPVLVGFVGFKLFQDQDKAPASALPTGDGRYFCGYNGAMLIAHDRPTQIQIKNNLVPFMERIPYLEQLSFLKNFKLQLNQAVESYEKDGVINVFEYKNMRIGTLICLDALFPKYAGKFVEEQANVFAIIANDGWAGNTSGYLQNAQYASPVAIALRRNVIRCATTGQSMFVDAAGKKTKVTPWNRAAIVISEVQLKNQDTFYAANRNLTGLTCLLLCAFFISGIILVPYKKFAGA